MLEELMWALVVVSGALLGLGALLLALKALWEGG